MNYSEVQAQFSGLLNRRDCTTTLAQTFISQGIQRIQRELRCPAMEKAVIVTIGSPYSGVVIPSDFIELINLIPVSTTPSEQERCEKCDITQAIQLASQPGTPRKYCRQGGLWLLGPAPADGDEIRLDYYAEFTPLVNGSDLNIATVSFPDLIIYSALSLAGDYFTDKRTATWEGRYQQILEDLNEMAQDDEIGGASAVQPAYVYPDNFGDNEALGASNWT